MRTQTKIKLAIYSCELTVIVTDSIVKEVARIYKKHNITDKVEGSFEGILVTPEIDKHFLLLDIDFLSHNTIAHEVYHAAVSITETRDIVEEEARAWLAGHVTGTIYKFLDRKKLKIKHG